MKLFVEEKYKNKAKLPENSNVAPEKIVEKDQQNTTFIFESISVMSWIVYGFPFLIHRHFVAKQKIRVLYYVSGSNLGIRLAGLTSWIFKASFERLEFRLVEIKDAKNDMYWFYIFSDELPALMNKIKDSASFQNIVGQLDASDRLPNYLFKRILDIDPTVINKRLARLLLLFQVITLKAKSDEKISLIIKKTLWFPEIKNFAKTKGINMIMLEKINFRIMMFEFLRKPIFKKYYHMIVYGGRKLALWARSKNFVRPSDDKDFSGDKKRMGTDRLVHLDPKLIVEYYGHLNLDSPELFSDLFFWQTSDLSGEDIVVSSQFARDPIDQKKYREMRKHKLHPLALNLKATAISEMPVAYYSEKLRSKDTISGKIILSENSSEEKWLKKQILGYEKQREYWRNIFIQYNIKLNVTWYKCNTIHMVMADAVKDVGGVGAIYQRSFECVSSPWFLTNTDVYFGFSSLSSAVEKDSGSVIPYFVETGYLGDHRFALLREQSQSTRNSLQKNGAKKILAYFDETSSHVDGRWGLGHFQTRDNYAFLLEKVLKYPDLGLIFKPKVPSTLRKRLGPIAKLLEEAELTGRCYVYEDGAIHGSYSPAVAALGADIAIHGHLFAGSAGIESALTGTPTIYLDREGCSGTSLYRLEQGCVIFNNWNALWSACQENWNTVNGMPGFGDWSSFIEEIDPFRDGRAAQRMGTYLNWILEGYKNNLSRKTILADAADRYRKAWGKDKVFSINC